MKSLRAVVLTISLIAFCLTTYASQVDATVISSGDDASPTIIYGENGGNFDVYFDLYNPSNSIPAILDFRWGIWNGTSEIITVLLNGNIIDSLLVSNAYWSNPTYPSYDVAGLLINGINILSFQEADLSQDYAIGKISLSYSEENPAVPEPSTLLLLGFGLGGVVFLRRRVLK